MEIREVHEVTEELVAAFGRLVPQLTGTADVPGRAALERIVASPGTSLFVAVDGDSVMGMLTLVIFDTPSGRHAWIEDVVVDEQARGRSLGESLCRHGIDAARTAGVRHIDLTSRPSRVAANALYRKLGFEERHTNIYRLVIDGGEHSA